MVGRNRLFRFTQLLLKKPPQHLSHKHACTFQNTEYLSKSHHEYYNKLTVRLSLLSRLVEEFADWWCGKSYK